MIPKNAIIIMLVSGALGCALTHLSITVMHSYGLMLFIGTPYFVGFISTIMYRYHRENPQRGNTFGVASASVFLMAILMLVTAVDGAICILLLFPLALGSAAFGCLVASIFLKHFKSERAKNTTILLLLIITPTLVGFEAEIDPQPPLRKIVTAVEVNADINKVWDLVVAFPEIEEPEELIFKLGISYPIDARIEGQGIGAIRYCNFSTGAFVEPITHWEKPTSLKFDVIESPVPMKETSIYSDLEPPHLHDIVISERGQFRLERLSNSKVILEGTTWYRHDMWPNWYWGPISDYIIHSIHRRVLNHIKAYAESDFKM